MKNINNLHTIGKSSKNIQSKKTKGFGYQVLGFGSGGGPGAYDIEYLVVAAGGGSGGGQTAFAGGGGGAGGYRESTQALDPGVAITVTVGTGGAAGVSNPGTAYVGGDGGASSISGTDLTTISSAGGGGGGGGTSNSGLGATGGSGGGSSGGNASGGSGDTPDTTPDQGNDGGPAYYRCAGGGGGSAAVGATADSTGAAWNCDCKGAAGGVGTINDIITTSIATSRGAGQVVSTDVYFAGGGSSGTNDNANSQPSMAGGLGGGGAGGNYLGGATAGTDGTDGTGGGGGGGAADCATQAVIGGVGGDGVVILRMATAKYSGTTTGSPSVDTDGTDTILIFKSSGSYTT